MDSEQVENNPPEQETEPEQQTQQPEAPQTRLCIRCKSTSNLFKNKHQKTCINCLEGKPKRERTEAQQQSFLKAQQNRLANIERRKSQLSEIESQAKKDLEKKIVKKAISIKKKQIRQTEILDEQISEDDTPLEEIVKIAKKKPARPKVKRTRSTDQEESNDPGIYMMVSQPAYSFC